MAVAKLVMVALGCWLRRRSCLWRSKCTGPALNGEFLFDDSYLPFLMPNVAEAPLRSLARSPAIADDQYWLNYQSRL